MKKNVTTRTTRGTGMRKVIGVLIVAVPAAAAFALVQLTGSPPTQHAEHPQHTQAPRQIAKAAATKLPSAPIALPAALDHKTTPTATTGKPVAASAAAPITAPAPGLARLLAGLHAADEQGDDDTRRRLHDELLAWAGQDPARASGELLAALRSAKDESEADVVLNVLTDELGIASRPEVAIALADIAQNDRQGFRRSAAVRGLGELPNADEGRMAKIVSVARADSDEDVRQSAAFALGAVSERAPGKLASLASKELVASLERESSPSVRTGLIYSVRDTRDPQVVEGLVSALSRDTEIAARQAAADILGDVAAAHRPRAVETLAQRFDAESDRDMKLTLLTSIIRAGRENAVKTLEGLKPRAGELTADVNDYLEGLKSGETDMDKLFAMKQERETARGVPVGGEHDDHDHD